MDGLGDATHSPHFWENVLYVVGGLLALLGAKRAGQRIHGWVERRNGNGREDRIVEGLKRIEEAIRRLDTAIRTDMKETRKAVHDRADQTQSQLRDLHIAVAGRQQ